MEKRLAFVIFLLLLLLSFSACSGAGPSGSVNFGEYEISSEEINPSKYDMSQLLSADESWQTAYALSYSYYDNTIGESQIAEGRCGNYYQSLDYSTNIITYLTQENGYMMEYMLNTGTKTGTAAVVTDSTIDDTYTGFEMLSVCDPYFPVYTNVTKVGSDFVANRSATRYKQVQTEDGVTTKIAYIWIDDMYGFASKCELYDAVTEELQLRWELLSFTQNVSEESIMVDLDAYTLTTGD